MTNPHVTCQSVKFLLAACLFALAPWLPAQVLVENISTAPQQRWATCGLPPGAVPGIGRAVGPAGESFRYVPGVRCVRLLVDLPANHRVLLRLVPHDDPDVDAPFEFAPSIGGNVAAVLPVFECGGATSALPQLWATGVSRPPLAFLRVEESDAAHQVWHLRTRIAALDLTIDEWDTIYSGEPTIEWTVHAVYGSTAPGKPLAVTLPALFRRSRCAQGVDFAVRTQTPANVLEPDGTWLQQLTPDGLQWGRAARIEQRGCTLTQVDGARLMNGALPQALFTGWAGRWLAGGEVPRPYPGSDGEAAGIKANYLVQRPELGGLYALRARCQPKLSGTTGEQVGFGFAPSLAVMSGNPFEISDGYWQVQSYCLRPTANKEQNGDPIQASAHPRTHVYNQRPDERFSAADMLGWPNPVPFSVPGSGYSTGDGQHRDDEALDAMIALTQDPALRSIADDYGQLEQLEVRPAPTAAVGAPRQIGRVLIAQSNLVWLGHQEVLPLVNATIEWVYARASYQGLPQDATHTVRILDGHDEAKYGWLDATGHPIVGWQGWQQAIAAGGLLQAYAVTNNAHARDVALVIAGTVVRTCFYQQPPATEWLHTYAQRSQSGPLFGVPYPAPSYFPQIVNHDGTFAISNFDVWTDGACFRWSMAACHIVAACAPMTADGQRAAAIIRWYGPTRSRSDSQWWATPPVAATAVATSAPVSIPDIR